MGYISITMALGIPETSIQGSSLTISSKQTDASETLQILVIDDDLSMPPHAAEFRRAYPVEGYEYLFAGSLEEAQTLLQGEHRVALILCDMRFEGLGAEVGLEILRELFRDGCIVPIAMLSSQDDRRLMGRCKDYGAVTFLQKWGINQSFVSDLQELVSNYALPGSQVGRPYVTSDGNGIAHEPHVETTPDRYQPIIGDRYRADFANGLDGWVFSPEQIALAKSEGRLLTLDMDSCAIEYCNLACGYCYRTSDQRDVLKPKENLTLDRLMRLVREAAELGVQSIKIVGAGEPFLDRRRNILALVRHMRAHGIRPVIFTNGTYLGEDRLARAHFKMTCQELAETLFDLGASLVLKMNGRVCEIQDAISQREGYSQRRNNALKLLVDTGFNSTNPTRLGIDSVILKQTYDQIYDDYVFFKEQNIYPVINTYIPCGLTADENNIRTFDVEPELKFRLFERILKYNASMGIPVTGISSYAGGQLCSQLGYGMYVTIQGEVYPCPAHNTRLGSIRERSLEALWARNPLRQVYGGSLDNKCPPRVEAGSLPNDFFEAMKKRLERGTE